MFKNFTEMNDTDKQKYKEMCGDMMFMAAERRTMEYIAVELKMPLYQVEHNFKELAYDVLRMIGPKCYLKQLFDYMIVMIKFW